jgi:hypothetical protein
MSKAPRQRKVKTATPAFAEYQGTTKINKSDQKETVDEQHPSSIIAQMPLKKHPSVQFYPVEHVQFISNRIGKTTK